MKPLHPDSPVSSARRPAAFMACLALAGPLAGLSAAPRQASAQAAEGLAAYDIPAGPLAQALSAYAQRADVRLAAPTDLVRDRHSPGVSGRYTAGEALERLLAGSGVAAERRGPGEYVLRAAPQGPAPAVLAPVTVTGAVRDPDAFAVASSDSATKTGTPLMETPRSISVVNQAQMEARGVVTLPEAVRYTAGVGTGSAGYDPRFDQISIRGFPVNTAGDYLDGLRQVPGSYAYFRSEPYALERVDIIKGPMSVLYGQGTPGGLVNRLSKRAGPDPVREVAVSGYTHDRRQVAFDVGDAFDAGRNANFRLVGLFREGEAERMIADDRLLLAPSLQFALGERTTLTLLGQYQKDETDSSVGMYVDNGHVTDIRVSDPDYDYQKQIQRQVGYELAHRLNDAVTLTQRLRYGDIDLRARYLSGAGLIPGTRQLQRSAWAVESEVRNVVVDNRALVRFDTGAASHSLLAGFDYQRLRWTQGVGVLSGYPALDLDDPSYGVGGATPPMNSVSVAQRNHQYGAYLSDQVSLGPWRLMLGGRYDWARHHKQDRLNGTPDQNKSEQAFTWQAGVLYKAANGVSPYLSYATSFMPNSSLDAAGNILDSTRGSQVEAGVKVEPPWLDGYFTVAAYRLEEKDAVRVVPATAYYERAGTIRSTGVEFEAVAYATPALQVLASYSYNRGKVTASNNALEVGKTPSYQPRHTASLWLDYKLPTRALAGVSVGAGLRYVGSSYGDSANTLRNPAAAYVDLALRYDVGKHVPALRGWSAALNVQNVANKEVPVCSGGYCYRSQGRMVLGQVRYRW